MRGGGGRAGGEIDNIRRAEEASDARSFPAYIRRAEVPAGEVSDARRYQTRGEVSAARS